LALRGKGTLGHVDTKKAYWGEDVQLHTILNLALDTREYQPHAPADLPPGKVLGTH